METYKEWLKKKYLEDETLWKEEISRLIKENKIDDIDYENLGDYLSEMAISERREVISRLGVLIQHRLKWDYTGKSGSWMATIREQRSQLNLLFQSAVLKNYALTVFDSCYSHGRKMAIDETNYQKFPIICPYSLDELLAE